MSAAVPRVPLGDDGYTISRLLVGGWQLSRGHRPGELDVERLFGDLERLARAGLTTFDCADIYTGVEELFGLFSDRCAGDLRRDGIELQLHTKLVPDHDALADLTARDVERVVDRSLRRLRTERLDLVQLSWWDYAIPGYVEAALALAELRRKGKLRHVGITNFDTERTRELLDAGVPVVSSQVQYSCLDRRPERAMADLARQRGFGILAYGSLAGGLLTDRYAGVAEEAFRPSTRSLVKYRLIVDELGGWEAYQELLAALRAVAERHGAPTSAVALRWVLDRPAAAGAIVGTYGASHLAANAAAFALELDDGDRAAIDAVLANRPGPSGEPFGLERNYDGRHGRLLWRNASTRA